MYLNMHLDMFPAMFNNTSLIFENSASRTKRSPEALQAQQCDLFAPMKSRWCILAHQFPGNLSRVGTGHPLARDGVDVGEQRARLLREVLRERRTPPNERRTPPNPRQEQITLKALQVPVQVNSSIL